MQARGFLNYRSKYCWPKVIYCICQPNELEREIKKKLGGKQGAKQKSGDAMQNRRQKVFNRGALRFCGGALHLCVGA